MVDLIEKARESMKCEELLRQLNEYVDGTIDPSICEEFQRHMEGCNPCQVVVDNIRKTITVYREGQAVDLPVAFRDKLHGLLRERWKQKHEGTPNPPGHNPNP